MNIITGKKLCLNLLGNDMRRIDKTVFRLSTRVQIKYTAAKYDCCCKSLIRKVSRYILIYIWMKRRTVCCSRNMVCVYMPIMLSITHHYAKREYALNLPFDRMTKSMWKKKAVQYSYGLS